VNHQDVEVNQRIKFSGWHSFEDSGHARILLLATTDENPKYKNDEGVRQIGKICILRTKQSCGEKITNNYQQLLLW